MARLMDPTFIPSNGHGKSGVLPLSEIPKELQDEFQGVYNAIKANPTCRFRIGFSTIEELTTWEVMAKSWAAAQEGDVYYRRSPTSSELPEGIIDYRIADKPAPKTPEEIAEIERRKAERAAKVAAGVAKPAGRPKKTVAAK